MYFELF